MAGVPLRAGSQRDPRRRDGPGEDRPGDRLPLAAVREGHRRPAHHPCPRVHARELGARAAAVVPDAQGPCVLRVSQGARPDPGLCEGVAGHAVREAHLQPQVQRRARKYNTGSIIITQQPSDFAAPSVIIHGKAIFDNASYYLVMGLKKQAVDDLGRLIDLNENEKESIKRYSQGEALFVCGNRRMRINVILTPEELESFGSGGGL